MRKISNRTKKVSIYISIVLLITFAIALVFLYQQKLRDVQAVDYPYSGSQVFTTEEMRNITITEFVEGARLEGEATYTTNLFHQYAATALSQMTTYIVGFVGIAIVLIIIIWNLIKQDYLNKIEKSVAEVLDIDTLETNADIKELVLKMKNEIEVNAHDYRQLQAYLAHEQKNSLSAIKSTLELDGQSEYIPYLDDISNSIDDLLTLSESNDSISETVVDITLICARAVDLSKKKFKEISFEFDEDAETFVLGEERWLYRAICNLLDNAIKYGENKPIQVKLKQKYNSIVVSVQDQGIGMEEKNLSVIFENRYRINELNNDGYGIGLSLVQHVCKLCNGNVWVESELHKGTTFYLSFPFVNEQEGRDV